MKLKRIDNFELIRVGETPNGLTISREAIEEAVARHAFNNAPIVFNDRQTFIDYRDNTDVQRFRDTHCIGYVVADTAVFDGEKVTATVMIQKEFANRSCYDNWCIDYDDDGSYLDYHHFELFGKDGE